jgi:phosphate-selective porin OprO/OprP
LAEYVIANHEVQKGRTHITFSNQSWQAAASYLITGELATYSGVSPLKPFDLKTGGWGAWEFAARHSELNIDDDSYTLGYVDPNTSASHAAQWDVGVNWYLNKGVKVAVNYGETNFDKGSTRSSDREKEKVFISRFQILF